jgi:hypothetical protein
MHKYANIHTYTYIHTHIHRPDTIISLLVLAKKYADRSTPQDRSRLEEDMKRAGV